MAAKDSLGRFGERLATRHLVHAGLEVLDRNWRCADGEVDVVARDGEFLVFCEVKTRSGVAHGDPVEAVSAAKANRLRRLAQRWIAEHGLGECSVRFDVVTVVNWARGLQVRHLRGAF